MKVWELINEIKGTNASQDEILNWMVMNKICPLDVGEQLEEGYQTELENMAYKQCDKIPTGGCGTACYREYLDLEVNNDGQ